MAGGITIQKNYITTSTTSSILANNWAALVLGVTSRGPTEPTLVQTYAEFVDKFGTAVPDLPTHTNINYLLTNRVPVLFKRLVDKKQITNASAIINETKSTKVQANENYSGVLGNNIKVIITKAANDASCYLKVFYSDEEVEKYLLGSIIDSTVSVGDLLYDFIDTAMNSNTPFDSKYITFPQSNLGNKATDWSNLIAATVEAELNKDYQLVNGSDGDQNTITSARTILTSYDNDFWKDNKLKNAAVYYPQLRLLSLGGITGKDKDEQNNILKTLGNFAIDCEKSFRILVDYPLTINTTSDEKITDVVRKFATDVAQGTPAIDPSVYAYVGGWGADGNNNWLPGSTGFLASLGRNGYNVYSRRVAGTAFNPGFTKSYDNLYVDAIKDWQDIDKVQLNPIVIVDAQDNLAVMGSSTLALPTSSLSAKNPAQALDVVLVGDYVAALLNNIALKSLKSALDRLSLNSLSNTMSNTIQSFVTSRAISKFDLTFDTTQLGKLGVECVLYFPIGLEEVSLTVTSVYDTTAI